MFLAQKPHPSRKEYHIICCGSSGVMLNIELVEGKDQPIEMGKKNLMKKEKQLESCCYVWLKGYGNTGKYVVLDSGFCVVEGLIEL